MSLFSIVQNRAPGPPAPQASVVASPPPVPMASAPAAPMPGFIDGTSRYLLDGVMEIPGYGGGKLPQGHSSTPGYGITGLKGDISAPQTHYYQRSTQPSVDLNARYAGLTESQAGALSELYIMYGQEMGGDPEFDEAARRMAISEGNRLDAAAVRSGPGPDHFYEQLAAEAAEAEKQRVDARQLANSMQANEQAKAVSEWKQAQLAANTQRANTIADTGTSAVSNFLSSMGYVSAANGPTVNFNPSAWTQTVQAGFGANPDPNAADANTPQLPGYVYPEGWGK